MLGWRWLSWWGNKDIKYCFAWKGGQCIVYELLPQINRWITKEAKPKIIDARLTLIFRVVQWPCRLLFCLSRLPIHQVCLTVTKSLYKYLAYMDKNRWHSVDAYLMNCLVNISSNHLLYKYVFRLIGCLSGRLRLSQLAKSSPVIFLHGSLSFYQNWYILLNNAFRRLYFFLWTNIQMRLLNILP